MDSSTRRRSRAARTIVAGVGLSLLLTGCGFDAQTLQPYTPAHGVNVDLSAGDNGRLLKVRNLLVVADDSGNGVVSASIVSPVADELVSIEGTALTMSNTEGDALTVTGSPVSLSANQMAILTDPTPAFTVSAPDLEPGLTVDLTLTFASGAQATAIAPVLSFDDPIYASISPEPQAAPSATADATATPAATAEPTVTPTP